MFFDWILIFVVQTHANILMIEIFVYHYHNHSYLFIIEVVYYFGYNQYSFELILKPHSTFWASIAFQLDVCLHFSTSIVLFNFDIILPCYVVKLIILGKLCQYKRMLYKGLFM